jgi:membrane protein DedA with SNARE-associated domain
VFELIVDFVSTAGYAGIFLLMAAENIFPPIPSEMIMPLAGFAAARGDLNMVLVVLAGTAGSILGALPWYYAGLLFGKERLKRIAARHGRWLTVSPDEIDKAVATFDRHERKAVFFGRLVPAIRTLISVPAGVARMRVLPFLAWSAAGSLIWTALLATAGYMLESQYAAVADHMDPVSQLVIAVVIVVYLVRFITHRPSAAK